LSIFAKKWVKNQKTLQRYEFFFKKTCTIKKKVVLLHPLSEMKVKKSTKNGMLP
jgi:hypothetical protein